MTRDRLLVRRQVRDQLELEFGLTRREPQAERQVAFEASEDYQHVRHDGRLFKLGATQARVVRCLAQAAAEGSPWVHTKSLLHAAQSNSRKVSDLIRAPARVAAADRE